MQYRHARPRTPQTNGMVEHLNGRIGSEVLGISIYSHRALEQLLRGFNAAYDGRRQRVLSGKTLNQVVAERLNAEPKRANPAPHGRACSCDAAKAPHRRSRQGGPTTRHSVRCASLFLLRERSWSSLALSGMSCATETNRSAHLGDQRSRKVRLQRPAASIQPLARLKVVYDES